MQNKPIKEVIMDGQVISGCGNIYATEALFKMGIHPLGKVSRISKNEKSSCLKQFEMFYMKVLKMVVRLFRIIEVSMVKQGRCNIV